MGTCTAANRPSRMLREFPISQHSSDAFSKGANENSLLLGIVSIRNPYSPLKNHSNFLKAVPSCLREQDLYHTYSHAGANDYPQQRPARVQATAEPLACRVSVALLEPLAGADPRDQLHGGLQSKRESRI